MSVSLQNSNASLFCFQNIHVEGDRAGRLGNPYTETVSCEFPSILSAERMHLHWMSSAHLLPTNKHSNVFREISGDFNNASFSDTLCF